MTWIQNDLYPNPIQLRVIDVKGLVNSLGSKIIYNTVVVQTLFIILLKVWDIAGTKSMYISIASLQELKELGNYEYFFRVYHNNEIYRAQTEIDLGLGWVKVNRPRLVF